MFELSFWFNFTSFRNWHKYHLCKRCIYTPLYIISKYESESESERRFLEFFSFEITQHTDAHKYIEGTEEFYVLQPFYCVMNDLYIEMASNYLFLCPVTHSLSFISLCVSFLIPRTHIFVGRVKTITNLFFDRHVKNQ